MHLMISKAGCPLVLAYDAEVAGSVAADFGDNADIRPFSIPRMLLDFGGAIISNRWSLEEIEHPDGMLFAFWPHQLMSVVSEFREAMAQAKAQAQDHVLLTSWPYVLAVSLEQAQYILSHIQENWSRLLQTEKDNVEEFEQAFASIADSPYVMVTPNEKVPITEVN